MMAENQHAASDSPPQSDKDDFSTHESEVEGLAVVAVSGSVDMLTAPGLADAIRRSGLPKVPTSVLSRGVCGVAGRTLVVNLPGSPGEVRDGLGVLADVLDHALDQIAGKDHPR